MSAFLRGKDLYVDTYLRSRTFRMFRKAKLCGVSSRVCGRVWKKLLKALLRQEHETQLS
jgi:hypothetical protein